MSDQIKQANMIPIKGKKNKLFLGSKWSAGDTDFIKHNNIKSILNLGSSGGAKMDEIKEVNLLKLNINDSPSEKISDFFKTAHEFIDKALKDHNILVHCEMGVSRSPTVVISYLMKKRKKTLDKAFKEVQWQRPAINPNKGFIEQLKKYEKSI